MNLQKIKLVSFGHFDIIFLEKIAEHIKREFAFPIKIIEGHLDIGNFYEPARRQYNANGILKEVDSMFGADNTKIVGLFNVDLFIPIFTYIFGQAFLKGRTGIASNYRLRNEQYGIPADNNLLLERFSKEIIHELGHTFGLIHCHVPDCVMRSGTYVEDIDQKLTGLCHKCTKNLQENA